MAQSLVNNALLHLLHLVSPALPVGAYAYSQGQEHAVELGYLSNAEQAREWIGGVMHYSLGRLDLPVLSRLVDAWHSDALETVIYWNQFLQASRESAEFELEDQQLGRALMRLLASFEIEAAQNWPRPKGICFATAFALAGCHWRIGKQELLRGFCWSWLENQVAAATKLVPLGQTDAQKLLLSLITDVEQCCEEAQLLADDEIGAGLPALAMISAQHETQYSRLFRS